MTKTERTVVFLDRETIAPDIALRRPSFPHRWVEYPRTSPDEAVARLAEAEIAILNKVPLREAELARLPHLRLIAVAATGTDCVDTAACAERGIAVSNIRGYAVHTVPEHTFALILALRRSLVGYRRDVADGAWQRAGQFSFFSHPVRELHGSRLGIFGEGALGQSVAALGRAFGMEVVFASHKGKGDMGPEFTPFEEVVETSDVLTMHCPLLPETRNLIGAAEFARMKPQAILVNTARGGLVDEDALVAALRSGRIAGAGFDVTTEEPPPPDHPFMALLDLPNFILTPHTAWAGHDAMQALADQLIDNVEGFVAGTPRNLVTPEG